MFQFSWNIRRFGDAATTRQNTFSMNRLMSLKSDLMKEGGSELWKEIGAWISSISIWNKLKYEIQWRLENGPLGMFRFLNHLYFDGQDHLWKKQDFLFLNDNDRNEILIMSYLQFSPRIKPTGLDVSPRSFSFPFWVESLLFDVGAWASSLQDWPSDSERGGEYWGHYSLWPNLLGQV